MFPLSYENIISECSKCHVFKIIYREHSLLLVVCYAASYGKLVFVIILFLIHSCKHWFAVQIVLTAHLVILVYPIFFYFLFN